MTRAECLDLARLCVLQDRQNLYGPPEDGFGATAKMWSAYTGTAIAPCDVAAMMVLLKVARLAANPQHADSWIDICGYSACGAELAPT